MLIANPLDEPFGDYSTGPSTPLDLELNAVSLIPDTKASKRRRSSTLPNRRDFRERFRKSVRRMEQFLTEGAPHAAEETQRLQET